MKKITRHIRRTVDPSYPANLPVTVAAFKSHSRIGTNSEDSLIESYLKAATNRIEKMLQRSLTAQTWKLSLSGFPCSSDPIVLPKPPFTGVSSFTYTKEDGTTGTMVLNTDYVVNSEGLFCELYPPYQGSWPSQVRNYMLPVQVTFTAGYTAVPDEICQAIRWLTAIFYRTRSTYLAQKDLEQLTWMVAPFRVLRF